MRLFVGLGNPGSEYSRNRHNVGFMIVEEIARRHDFQLWRSRQRFDGDTAEGIIDRQQVILLKPSTMMNASGYAVRSLLQFYKLQLEDLSVFHDEIELPAGGFRVKVGGSDAGHNGLRSISESIGPSYRRVRIGVGKPEYKSQVHSHVLGDFSPADLLWLNPMISAIAGNIDLLVVDKDSSFQNKVHIALQGAGFGSRGKRRPPSSS
jgi:peptidyl-tRNA hydrolase, PTH1 family